MKTVMPRSDPFSFSVKDPEMEVLMRVPCVALFAVLVFSNLPAIAFAQSPCPGIHVKILNIRNSTGTVDCALFESPIGFPIEFLRSATNVMVIKGRNTQAPVSYTHLTLPTIYSV